MPDTWKAKLKIDTPPKLTYKQKLECIERWRRERPAWYVELMRPKCPCCGQPLPDEEEAER